MMTFAAPTALLRDPTTPQAGVELWGKKKKKKKKNKIAEAIKGIGNVLKPIVSDNADRITGYLPDYLQDAARSGIANWAGEPNIPEPVRVQLPPLPPQTDETEDAPAESSNLKWLLAGGAVLGLAFAFSGDA